MNKISVCTCIYTYKYIHKHIFVCLSLLLARSLSPSMYMHIYIYVWTYAYIYIHIHLCVDKFMSTHKRCTPPSLGPHLKPWMPRLGVPEALCAAQPLVDVVPHHGMMVVDAHCHGPAPVPRPEDGSRLIKGISSQTPQQVWIFCRP